MFNDIIDDGHSLKVGGLVSLWWLLSCLLSNASDADLNSHFSQVNSFFLVILWKHKRPNYPTIIDYIRKIRNENRHKHTNTNAANKNKIDDNTLHTQDNDIVLSTQEMINDARVRRIIRKNEFTCEKCEFKSASEALLRRHDKSHHKETKATSSKKVYTSKRLKCNMCAKKFNKLETFDKHMKTFHETDTSIGNNNLRLNKSNIDLPEQEYEAQPRVTRQREKRK